MSRINRRIFLGGLGSLIGAGALTYMNRNEVIRQVVLSQNNEQLLISDNLGELSDSCVLSPEQTEGPFYVRSPIRQNIREDRNGFNLDLSVRVLSSVDCKPLAGALVEIWHCDASGRYSAYPEDIARQPWETIKLVGLSDPNGVHVEPTNKKNYLRGGQISNDEGEVRFSTIFPGWYDPRIPHIHIAVTVKGVRQYTSQLYFPMAFANEIYGAHQDYKSFGLCPYELSNDPVLAEFPDARGLLVTPKAGGNRLNADATFVLS